jgi:hypothetical protein
VGRDLDRALDHPNEVGCTPRAGHATAC